MIWTRHTARTGEGIDAYRVFAGKPERKRPPGRSRQRWEYSIKIDLAEYDGGKGLNWIDLAQDRDRLF